MSLFRDLGGRIAGWWHKFRTLTACDGNPMTDEMPSYTHCKNCGTQLQGMFCHKCGQDASSVNPNRRAFIKEYILNELPLDSLMLPALSNLIFHPGRMAKEYCAGRYASHIHPLKLNILILFVLLLLFSLMGSDTKLENALHRNIKREMLVSEMAMSAVSENEEYIEKMKSSPRDTVTLAVSKVIVEEHQGVVEVLEVISLTPKECPDTLRAVVPTVLFEDNVLVRKDDVYAFSCDNDVVKIESLSMDEIEEALTMLYSKLMNHLALLMMLTAPFMVLALSIVLRHKKRTKSDYYVFTYYYLAFVEFMLMVLYMAGIVFGFTFSSVSMVLRITLFTYLVAAMKYCYDISTWFKSVLASLFVYIIYLVSSFTFVLIVSLVALIAFLVQMM